ncbi:glycerol-3-phosphate dehydrogenase/oxidase [Rhodovulum sulfidophilum]|nr:glycerol-3-phosphate dehydrogenase/oxidase [Rhodovulum sulfidophilum]
MISPHTLHSRPATQRHESATRLDALAEPEVLILGGGVNGVATLRELALNDVSCVLIDTGDFCAGASGASSRMAHGGLRYLEGREFRLVAESARERNRLVAHAGHLVSPLEIVVPLEHFVTGFGRAILRFLGLSNRNGPISLLALEGGLLVYEIFGRREHPLPSHSTFLRRAGFPKGLRRSTRAVTSYFDGQITQPEGLVLEMLGEALDQGPHVAALNHVSWQAENGAIHLSDRLGTGSWTLRPKVIINATGAWIDRVNAGLGGQTRYLRGIKGAHLVLHNPELFERMGGRAFYFDDGTGRMVISLPVDSNVLVGTTEVETSDPDDRRVAGDEIDYLIRAMDGLFTDIAVDRTQIVSVTSGIRPLRRGGQGSATSAARDHALEEDRFPGCPAPVLSLVGGKWTTFRSFGEQSADRALALLGRTRSISTAARGYPGAAPCAPGELDLPLSQAARLIGRYGALARKVAPLCRGHGATPLAGAPDWCRGEIRWAIRARGAATLEDLVLRRTRLSFGAGLRPETLDDLVALLSEETGRPMDELAAERQAALSEPRLMGTRAGPTQG